MTTYCEEYAALLDPFVDGELTAEEMTKVQAHLATCPGCRAYVDDALTIRAAFPDPEDTEVPEGFAEGVMERIRADAAAAETRKKRNDRKISRRRWTGTLAALAACFAVVLLARGVPHDLKNGGRAAPNGDAPAPAAYAAGAPEAQAETDAAYDFNEEAAPEEPAEAPPVQARTTGGGEAAKTFDAAADGGAAKYNYYSGDETGAEGAPAGDEAVSGGTAPSLAAMPECSEPIAPEESPEGLTVAGLPGGTETEQEASLYLTEEEAGGLLNGKTPIREDGAERQYELTEEEFQALMTALGRLEELEEMKPESEKETVLVVVTGPGE